jgi:hypothetical protein
MSEKERTALNEALWAWFAITARRYRSTVTLTKVVEQLRVIDYEAYGRDNAN